MDQDKIKPNPEIEKKLETACQNLPGAAGNLAQQLWRLYEKFKKQNLYFGSYFQEDQKLLEAYTDLCGVSAAKTKKFDDFWNKDFALVMEGIFGLTEASGLKRLCESITLSPYSKNYYRPSFRSNITGDYYPALLKQIIQHFYFLSADLGLCQSLTRSLDIELDNYLAQALISQDKEIEALVSEAISGDNSRAKLSYCIIRGVVKSGRKSFLEMLGQLLLAAKLQEGLRQSILENADAGSCETHAFFIKVCLDHDLVRFSAVIRAMATWSGLAFDNTKPPVIRKCFELANDFLTDKTKLQPALKSPDVLEIYLALWSTACRDIHEAQSSARTLLDAPEKYRRLLGWYFILHTAHDKIKHQLAVEHIDVREPEELAWICCNLYTRSQANYSYGPKEDKYPAPELPDSPAVRRDQFQKITRALEFIGHKNTRFEPSVFPWSWVELKPGEVVQSLIGLAGYDKNPELILKLAACIPYMDAGNRQAFYKKILDPKIPEQKEHLLEGLGDSSVENRKSVVEILSKTELDSSDIDSLTSTLTSQSSSLRKAVMTVLGQQQPALVMPVIDRLIRAKNNKQLLAGLELLDIFSLRDKPLSEAYEDRIKELKTLEKLPNDLAVILKRFDSESVSARFAPENGFGLYDPKADIFNSDKLSLSRPEIELYPPEILAERLKPDEDKVAGFIYSLKDLLIKHKDSEVVIETYDKQRIKVLIGNNHYNLPLLPDRELKDGQTDIFSYYLADEIMEIFENSGLMPLELEKSLFIGRKSLWAGRGVSPDAKRIFRGLPYDETVFNFHKYAQLDEGIIRNIFSNIIKFNHIGIFDFALSAWQSLSRLVTEDDILKPYDTEDAENNRFSYGNNSDSFASMFDINLISYWRRSALRNHETDAQFAVFFKENWYQYSQTGFRSSHYFSPDDLVILKAYGRGLISLDAVYFELLLSPNSQDYIRLLTSSRPLRKKAETDFPFIADVTAKAVDRIVTVEEKRGELPTPLTPAASEIMKFYGGSKHFAALLTALGNDNFHRGYLYRNFTTKQEVLSALLKRCYPRPDDTGETFKEAIAEAKISRNRILQAVMYAPQWVHLAEQAAGIIGLASAVWLFQAHISEHFSAEKETQVATFSPISPQQFVDGTFDKTWFMSAYETVGSDIFQELYKHAKYLTDSNSAHRRSQLYTDAILGRLNKNDLIKDISDKRNQEKLRALPLIPLDPQNPKDALERYEFIRTFLKQSRQFGSARQASEGKAAASALENLALTTGFDDRDRLSWYMESEKLDSLKHLLEDREIGEYRARMLFDEDGTPSLSVSKNGQPLKSVPKAVSKNEDILEIQKAVKDLKDQKIRAREGFEMAMVASTAFRVREIVRLFSHPVLSRLIKSLVLASSSGLGFPLVDNDRLILLDTQGREAELKESEQIRIAHPYDLMNHKVWSGYQKHLFKNQIVQPFKQVFREYYALTADEKEEVTVSRRYAGHQIQPQKTLALLKRRGWTVDYEEGLQKVCHRENLIARMYALADWFSPADIEAPTLETVRFFSRDRDEIRALAEIPPIIFSEVMRDIDLVVSVAHVGGVDPEASHSTVEMRAAIAEELVNLLNLSNVSFKTSHALVKGTLGDYSVHLGSGIVHKSGTGMVAIIPVHSQARGRIFLPFADDDPRTAEIMSKILLLAEDNKIKDPIILEQILGALT
ncbi:MAG: DUF4132 domain-containing protein [Deltaproteobacteria bacterium]|jgi:hypothetical protein|nr:DUF4132 domain-containing protein [Deltaproteobacteria bacterium]